MKYTATLLLVAGFAVLVAGQFRCPEKDGQYEDEEQCDKYYNCVDGEAEEMLCDDGLVFDSFKRGSHKCDHQANVECEERTLLQPPQGNTECRRKNGFFEHPVESNCHMFVTCIDGQANYNQCPAKLVFDEKSGVCAWPENVNRVGCVREEALDDGFVCPKEKQFSRDGNTEAHPRYPHPDCQKFYICLNGVTPREHGCALGEVYNADTKQCDAPENVEDCADFYDDHPLVGKQKEVGDRTVFKSE